VRVAHRLGIFGFLLFAAAGAFAQNLAVTTAASGFNNPYGVAVDALGNAYVADTSNNAIRKVTSAGAVSYLAGSSSAISGSTDVLPGLFNGPRGIAINSAGTVIYVSDTGNNAIRVITLSGIGGSVSSITTVSVSGSPALSGPAGVALDSAGTSLYVADRFNHLIRKISLPGGSMTTVAGLSGLSGSDNGDSSVAKFSQPAGVALSSSGDSLFVADYNNHVIRRVFLSPVSVTTYAGTMATLGGANSSVGTSATFWNPAGVAVDASNNVYVADLGNNSVRMISASGSNAVTTVAGSGAQGSSDGIGIAATFRGPNGIAAQVISSTQYIYVADTSNSLLRKASAAVAPALTSPASQSAAVGANGVTLTSTVTAGWPSPVLQWQRQPGGTGLFQSLSNGVNYSGVDTATLTVNNVSLAMQGDKFKLVATNSSGITESPIPATLTVTAGASAPVFAASTVTFTASVGQFAAFTNAATGSGTVTYAVTSGSSGIFTLNSSTGAITGTPSSTADSTTFVVTASNGVLPNATCTVTINVLLNAAPVINTQPQSQTVSPGFNTAAFTVGATASPAITGYQWQRKPAGSGVFTNLTEGYPYSGTTSATLFINAVSAGMNGDQFQVLVSNGVGSPVQSSAAALFVGVAPTFTSPAAATFAVGFVGSFTVTSSATPSATYSITGGSFPSSWASFNTSTGVISGVPPDQTGSPFTFVVTASNGFNPPATQSFTLYVNAVGATPSFTTQPANYTAQAGQPATLTGVAVSSPAPLYRWQRQAASASTFVDLFDDATYSGAGTATLSIAISTSVMNGDQFRLVATNVNGSATSNVATLSVNSIPPTIVVNPSSVTANIGSNLTFSGSATSSPDPTYRWQRQAAGTTGFVNLADDGVFSGTGTVTLSVTGVNAGMNGDSFRLSATSAGGVAYTSSATVTVNLGTTFTTLAGLSGSSGAVDATGAAARFAGPTSIVVDVAGNFYIADQSNSVIRKMTPLGVVTTIAGLAGARGNVDGVGTAARFNSPAGVAVDALGNVYVADTFNHTIRVINPSGVVSTLAGSSGSSGAVDGTGAVVRLSLPTGVAVDAAGTVYIADSGNHAIRRLSNTGAVSTFAGTLGTAGYFDTSVGLLARFNSPNSIVLDGSGNLYVADAQNNAIRKITPSGAVTTVAGNLVGVSGSTDANGSAAFFNRPSGIALDSSGNLYVADTNNNTVRRISTFGDVTTLAGQAPLSGAVDGSGSAARFNRPFGIAVDASGNVYVADTGNATIRRTGSATGPVIITNPADTAAAPGNDASFTVVAGGSPTPTIYQWQRKPVGSSDFVNLGADATYTGVTTATLTVHALTSAMNGDQFRAVAANGVTPAAVSNAATLSIGVLPVFTSVAATSFRAGEANSFTITTTSPSAVTYSATGLPSWAGINPATGAITGTPPDQSGSPFSITIRANNGVVATQTFILTILPPNIPPSFASQPANVTSDPGQGATFSVTANGTAPFTYQWRRNGIAISGATNSSLVIAGVQAVNAGVYSVAVTNVVGTAVSTGGTLTVNVAPTVASQPRSQVAVVGGTASFSVTATGGSGYIYQWRKNGVAIAGANSATYTLGNVIAADAGNYDVVITNGVGSAYSSVAQLTVATGSTIPVITAQPAGRAVLAGSAVTLSVAATGAPAPAYQWRKNGTPISGAVGSSYLLGAAQASDSASYDVVVSNTAGTVNSSAAALRVFPRSFAGVYFGSFSGNAGSFAIWVRDDNTGVFLGYLPGFTAPVMNLSFVLADNGQFTFAQGAVATTAAANEGEPVRAAALAAVSVSGTIAADGSITGSLLGGANASLSGTKTIDTGATQHLAGFYQAGAATGSATAYTIVSSDARALFVLQSATASDGGTGTVAVGGQINGTTTRTVVTATINPFGSTITGTSSGAINAAYSGGTGQAVALQRLVNISSRARVGSADAVAIAGFVISGTESKPVLIRAVGPTLGGAPFNVPGVLTTPSLELFRGATSIATNTGIGANRAAIDAAGQLAGAFGLGAAGTDAAILTTLAPGNYTAVVSSTSAAAGVALVEVYDLSGVSLGQKLLNISTRAAVGSGDNVLIAGFVVPPGTTKRVLIRGVGPGLGAFGVAGTLAQPTLTLYSGSTSLATNTNWSTSADAAAITAGSLQVGAFGLSSNDSALVATLAPGNYTAQVTGAGTTTGVALIEVYELP
jgi:DNA-binding beta-propeller fold protein YncE